MDGARTFGQTLHSFFADVWSPGFALDLFVFLINLGAVSFLTRLVSDMVVRAANGETGAQSSLMIVTSSLLVLAPMGAVLKRWHAHQSPGLKDASDNGCLFSPVFYFCLIAVVFATVNAFVMQAVYGRREPPEGVFVGAGLGGFLLIVVHTILVYRYFSKPGSPPRWTFLRSRAAAYLGDFCFFANMLVFQLFWNLLSGIDLPRPTGFLDFVFRFLVLVFLALLVYFPPRMFYLAQDLGKRWTWPSILMANSPVIVRVLFGGGNGPGW